MGHDPRLERIAVASLPRAAWGAAMAAANEAFAPGNRFGVVGYGIERKRRRGRPEPAWALRVYVESKASDPVWPVPTIRFAFDGNAMTVLPDVVAIGRRARSSAGVHPNCSGLRSGGAILVGPDPHVRTGGTACLLSDDGVEPRFLLTAGHLFAAQAHGVPVRCAESPSAALALIGSLEINLLDTPAPGEPPRDAALVRLNDRGREMAKASAASDVLRLTSVVPDDLLEGWNAHAFSPVANDFSGDAMTFSGPFAALMDAPDWPGGFVVRDVIRTGAAITVAGDSGTTLVPIDAQDSALGSCTGEFGSASLFEPIARSLAALRSQLGTNLMLWTPS